MRKSFAVAKRWRSLRQRLVDAFAASAALPPAGLRFERLGSAYGGWVVPANVIAADWICYCGGVGEDITFDLELIRRFGCTVVACDPTPRAQAHASKAAAGEERFRFLPIGLWSEETELRFYAPRNPSHVSHSAVNLQGTSDYFVAPCTSLAAIMREQGHERIDLLKLDIEGAQHEVLRAALRDGIRPTVICVEFDQPDTLWRMYGSYARLRRAGYQLAVRDGWNLTFLRAA